MDSSELQDIANNSPVALQLTALQSMVTDSPQTKKANQVQLKVNFHPTKTSVTGIENTSVCQRDVGMAHCNNLSSDRILTPVIQNVKAKTKKPGKKKKKPSPIKRTMTVRNKEDEYTSGLINQITLPQGVQPGPRGEAQRVANILGGSWVGGHMVNDQLGGTGGYKNIVPITSSMNGLHKSIENKANNYLTAGNGTQIEYKMKILKRASVKYIPSDSIVKNLPVEFQQTLKVFHTDGRRQMFIGQRLVEDKPGEGKIQN